MVIVGRTRLAMRFGWLEHSISYIQYIIYGTNQATNITFEVAKGIFQRTLNSKKITLFWSQVYQNKKLFLPKC
uniref:Uncharacterized protein n=1 Tax=Octopus bimaculoides TaxID=37653 RepID=A0A0L8GU49_OCTBM